ncbi:ABC transporter ATP-binding protein [Pseudooceanicola sp. CBS1P-1]|uniref:ATP-binding cassette domain-containing protein n=1 Tax=Pseudooceanicola albus TaxID=2692189 RepID=A0A6L7G6P0_9RHOB|nr:MULTISPECIES: ABC transporter ATP-binding protein [Pseudooceanicola]MBT9382990.1 ABC transporter ATP-binding protein [Pseudooceanicola endophyticus]MXN19178.1 ATP-binding cassette domain-containing protein [Pseudooceanicola albus]
MIADLGNRAPILNVRSVDKTFNKGVVALRRLSLTVNEGDFISLLGPSGCGKSTALRLIAGLMEPSIGKIDWTGGQGADDLGVVFQEPTLMPWATVAKNVWTPFRLRGQSFRSVKDRIEEALSLVGLEKFANAYPRELSGGMKMRVSIARALVTRPRLILMDEPFAALDEITRQKLNDDLLNLKARTGATVIFVTHSVFESVFLSDRILVMAARPGRIIKEIQVPEPYPRGIEWRTSAEYARIARETSDTLHGATGATEAAE